MSVTPVILSVNLCDEAGRERTVTVEATVRIYAGRIYVESLVPRYNGVSLSPVELDQAEEQVDDYVLAYRQDIKDEALEDLRGYPLGGGDD